ncbi:MAG TPA: PP2C family protein-serine/threonine phosphatase [Terriglobales bacterium]|nr:PP2C family protein-serine/threonine phosphatase [Terriglobales bacterium]
MLTPASQPVGSPPKRSLRVQMEQFWRRVTDGLELNQLWSQFQADARSSYRLYTRDIDSQRKEGVRRGRHWWEISKQFFWAILEKLSPARRVLLLVALVLLIFNPTFGSSNAVIIESRLWGGLLLLLLLVLEVADRVVMKRDLQIAREIQMWLLPASPPAVPGLEIAFATRPANTVAGDYYDVFPRLSPDGSAPTHLIAVADVAGKSIPAALLMATFQASLKTVSTTCCSLEDLLGRLNHYMCTNSQGGLRFTTAFVAEYDPRDRLLTYINAGHNAPILRRCSGAIERLQAGGLPLGIQDDCSFQTGKLDLQTGDWLVIFTDGVIEAINDRDEEYGETRLLSMIHASPAVSPTTLLSRIMVDLDFFVGNTPQHDDITCLVMKAA